MTLRRVGFIGLGTMGTIMATRILQTGFELHVWNQTPAKTQSLRAAGARVARSPAELARSVDLICLCVTDEQAVEEIMFSPDGIASAGISGLQVADHSTIHPAETRRIAERFAGSGGRWTDSPVSGFLVGAEAGTLAVFAGGQTEDIERIRPVLMSYAGRITHLGTVGTGQIGKICNQMISFGTAAALAESLHLAARSGVAIERFPQAMEGAASLTPRCCGTTGRRWSTATRAAAVSTH